MKTYLLIFSLVAAVVANNIGVNAQSSAQRVLQTKKALKQVNKIANDPALNQSAPLPSVKNQKKNGPPARVTTNCPVTVTPLGSAGNAFGASGGPRTNLWYDNDLHTVAFTHRSTCNVNGAKGTGWIMYDYSTDDGNTWPAGQLDRGPTYKDNTATNCLNGTIRGRYPAGGIYNPSGNTNPANAWMNSFGPITNDALWTDNFEGTRQIGGSTNKQNLFPYTSTSVYLNDGYHIVKNSGTIWTASQGEVYPEQTRTFYNDTIVIGKGVFNVDDVNFTFSKLYAPISSDADGKLYVTNSVAFNDAGDIGYIVIIGNDQVPLVDSVYYPIVYKTEDGGNSWTRKTDFYSNMYLHFLDAALLDSNFACTSAFDVDCAVDKDNNLHIALDAGYAAPNFAIASAPGYWGVFDIYTTDGGDNWYAQLMCTPQTFRGEFGDGSAANPTLAEDPRMQATRSWDGSKIFISWFDTDTLQFGTTDNTIPDWFVRGLDVTNGMLTAPCYNVTKGSDADGFCTFGCVSYYSIPTGGGDENIPMVYASLVDPTQTGSPVSFYYVNGGCVKATDYTYSPEPVFLGYTSVANNVPKANFAVSSNYPNPFNGFTTIDVTLPKTSDVTVELNNMVGQVLGTTNYKNLNGKNSLTIDGSNLASGIYIYKVKADGQIVTRTMTVK